MNFPRHRDRKVRARFVRGRIVGPRTQRPCSNTLATFSLCIISLSLVIYIYRREHSTHERHLELVALTRKLIPGRSRRMRWRRWASSTPSATRRPRSSRSSRRGPRPVTKDAGAEGERKKREKRERKREEEGVDCRCRSCLFTLLLRTGTSRSFGYVAFFWFFGGRPSPASSICCELLFL